MNGYNHIEELLERYFEGMTSEAEEQTLHRFFTEAEVPEHLKADRELFLRLWEQRPPQGMEQRLENLIDQWDTQERRTIKAEKRRNTLRLQWIGNIAACLLLLFGAGWYLSDQGTHSTAQDTCATPEEAYAQAEKALVMFSTVLNKGMNQMAEVRTTTEKAERTLQKQLNKIKE